MKEINGPSRQILHALKKSEGGMTVEDLCRVLQVTPMAIHRPITALVDQGLVRAELLRGTKRGRPVRRYRLTEAADDLFPKNYGGLLLDFLQELGNREGVRRIRALFQARFRRSLQNSSGRMKGKDLAARVRTLSTILEEKNYMAEHQQINNRKFEIKLMNCPISKIAREYPEACACEQHFLSRLLDAKVLRDHHILNGQNYCSYVIRRK